MSKIDDIKTIRERTEFAFSLQACKDAYEAHGCDVEAAIAYLSSMIVKPVNELTDTERAEIEAYKKKAEKRASKKSEYPSEKQRTHGVIAAVGAILFFLLGVASLVLSIAEKGSSGWIAPTVIGFVLSVACAFAWSSAKTMSKEEYDRANRVVPKEITYREGDTLACPCCGSHEVQFFEPKFNRRKALLGTVISGSLLGAYFGVPKPGEYKAVCNHCGHHWKAKIK